MPRPGSENLIANPTVDTPADWSLHRDAQYDTSTSRGDDGSGSIRLMTPAPNTSIAQSTLIRVRSGHKYTYGFYFKTSGGPTYIGAQISLHDANRQFIRNHVFGIGGATRDGQWQEFAMPFIVPANVAFVGCEVVKAENTQPDGIVWADDFYLGEEIGLDQPPSPKRPFDGSHVRVDSLGNFEIKSNDGGWTPFFPLCIYSDNHRDWSVYSEQGWNTVIWTGSAAEVKQARDAVSTFNPNGMKAGFAIAQYTLPTAWAYNNLEDLRAKLREIFDQGLDDSLLLYYWDNEIHHEQWQVPVDVINTIKSIDIDASGGRLHPIYALQGNYNIARVHAAHGLVDVSGTYFGGGGGDAGPGHEGSFILDRLEQQTSPAAFAQFNDVSAPGEMRQRLYHAIVLGAKAIGYWRDCYGPNANEPWSVGPVDQELWWPDFPNLRREVDRLLPIIRQPHWTPWKVHVEPADVVHVGTRDHQRQGHLILVNRTTDTQRITLRIDGLGYECNELWDVLNDEKVASASGDSFEVTLPGIGIGSGTQVLRLVSPAARP